MNWQVFAERAPLQANPEVWAAFQEQQPEFIRFFRAVQAALEVYGETLRIYQQVSGEAGYGARPGDLDVFGGTSTSRSRNGLTASPPSVNSAASSRPCWPPFDYCVSRFGRGM